MPKLSIFSLSKRTIVYLKATFTANIEDGSAHNQYPSLPKDNFNEKNSFPNGLDEDMFDPCNVRGHEDGNSSTVQNIDINIVFSKTWYRPILYIPFIHSSIGSYIQFVMSEQTRFPATLSVVVGFFSLLF